jgi:hypothetical protein
MAEILFFGQCNHEVLKNCPWVKRKILVTLPCHLQKAKERCCRSISILFKKTLKYSIKYNKVYKNTYLCQIIQ